MPEAPWGLGQGTQGAEAVPTIQAHPLTMQIVPICQNTQCIEQAKKFLLVSGWVVFVKDQRSCQFLSVSVCIDRLGPKLKSRV